MGIRMPREVVVLVIFLLSPFLHSQIMFPSTHRYDVNRQPRGSGAASDERSEVDATTLLHSKQKLSVLAKLAGASYDDVDVEADHIDDARMHH